MKKYKIFALVGKAGSGKDTILNKIMQEDKNDILFKIVSNTTRPPREGERDGIDYHFLTVTEYEQKIANNELLESSNFNNWYYGTSYDNLSKNKINIGIFNPQGIKSLINNSKIDLKILYIDCNDKTRLLRQLNREKTPNVDEIIRRYNTDKKDFEVNEINSDIIGKSCFYLIINDEFSNLNNIAETAYKIITSAWYNTWAKKVKIKITKHKIQ